MGSKQRNVEWGRERSSIVPGLDEYPEQRKKSQEKILLPTTFSLVWGLAMVVVGAMVIEIILLFSLNCVSV